MTRARRRHLEAAGRADGIFLALTGDVGKQIPEDQPIRACFPIHCGMVRML